MVSEATLKKQEVEKGLQPAGMEKSLAETGPQLGLEEVGAQDLILPHIILTQPLTKFVTDGIHPPGILVNTLTKQPIAFEVITPFYVSKYVDLLKPEGGRMVFEERIFDPKDPKLAGRTYFNKKDANGNKVLATATLVLVIFALVDGQPAIVAFKKMSYWAGKTLVTLAKMAGGNLWDRGYRLMIKKIQDANTYWILEVEDAGETSSADRGAAFAYYQSFKTKHDAVAASEENVPF